MYLVQHSHRHHQQKPCFDCWSGWISPLPLFFLCLSLLNYASAVNQVKASNVVDMRYRVEKLGKRSYDGISGEVTASSVDDYVFP